MTYVAKVPFSFFCLLERNAHLPITFASLTKGFLSDRHRSWQAGLALFTQEVLRRHENARNYIDNFVGATKKTRTRAEKQNSRKVNTPQFARCIYEGTQKRSEGGARTESVQTQGGKRAEAANETRSKGRGRYPKRPRPS